MEVLLGSKEEEVRSLHGELARRDTTAQDLEISLLNADSRLRDRDKELSSARSRIDRLETEMHERAYRIAVSRRPAPPRRRPLHADAPSQ